MYQDEVMMMFPMPALGKDAKKCYSFLGLSKAQDYEHATELGCS